MEPPRWAKDSSSQSSKSGRWWCASHEWISRHQCKRREWSSSTDREEDGIIGCTVNIPLINILWNKLFGNIFISTRGRAKVPLLTILETRHNSVISNQICIHCAGREHTGGVEGGTNYQRSRGEKESVRETNNDGAANLVPIHVNERSLPPPPPTHPPIAPEC